MIGWEEPHPEDVIKLPEPHPIDTTVGAAVKKRRSRRDFTGEQLSMQELADILGHSAGRTGSAHVELAEGGEVELPLYATANGGGLRPIEVYVMPLNVQDTEPVVHRYDRRRRVLIKDPDAAAAAEVIDTCISPPDQKHMSLASAVFLLTARPWRSMRKYGARGLRFSFLEAGSVAAAIALAATALELGAVECGSLCDNEVHSLLQIDGIFETYVHSIIVGRRP
ncbi:SagB/ThcOx family dehydrogenase [Actinomyces wuliandei]|uniref:SagB/ThcOx family dehydrogenase n=1 Tax=Actinomyces wuliandei TaxID=2057743 RepID=UPI00111B0B71|nr:SagB/ThcOx family dehydrogenase [Actinomyces wuliandei]